MWQHYSTGVYLFRLVEASLSEPPQIIHDGLHE